MAVVFLNYPMNGKTYDKITSMYKAMAMNYDAVTGTTNSYISYPKTKDTNSLSFLVESLQCMDKANVVAVHPDWLKEYHCKAEAGLAEVYKERVFFFDESRWDLIDWISDRVNKPTVRAKIIKLCDERCIWTKELFAKIDISELEKVKGMGPITVRTLKDLQQKIQTS